MLLEETSIYARAKHSVTGSELGMDPLVQEEQAQPLPVECLPPLNATA